MNAIDNKRIVIVDGYSTGRELARELVARNVECLHLRSTPELPVPVTGCFDATVYDADLGHAGAPEEAADLLAGASPHAVVAGSEWGVTYAERLALAMGLPTNRADTLAARRDKFAMIEAVRRRGLLVARQKLVATAEEAHAWAAGIGEWPIVVKPLASAGADGVSICRGHADIDAAFARTLGQENVMGGTNHLLLLQSFLPGPQYIVNTVSWGGRHCVTDIWSMGLRMSGNAVVPEGIHLMDPEAAPARRLAEYTRQVLDALGIENGAAHSELKLTPQGPALIETGARLMGAAMDEPSYIAAGMRSQASIFAGVLAGCAREREALLARGTYRLRLHMTKLLFTFLADGTIRGTAGLQRLNGLDSFHMHYRPLPVGAAVRRTADWLACGGVIYLVHPERQQIEADIETIRAWERSGELYDVALAAPVLAMAA